MGNLPGSFHSSRRPVHRLRRHNAVRFARTGRRCNGGLPRRGNLPGTSHSSRLPVRRLHRRSRARVPRTGPRCTGGRLRKGNLPGTFHSSRRPRRKLRRRSTAPVARTGRRCTPARSRTGNLPGTSHSSRRRGRKLRRRTGAEAEVDSHTDRARRSRCRPGWWGRGSPPDTRRSLPRAACRRRCHTLGVAVAARRLARNSHLGSPWPGNPGAGRSGMNHRACTCRRAHCKSGVPGPRSRSVRRYTSR